ncbi:MAG: thioredoxin domain-containing protein [Clostridia bacterium]|nr:thioredoxin domain-containing protein [Clostridia bacterium]
MSVKPSTQNRLAEETSPYLRQHAHQPVDWWPWCAPAFARARLEDKPVFLSIGYSTCHWCHVMAEESFEDAGIAAQLNKDFISIKVDREERPDIDAVYMRCCTALTGSGGWPLTVFLTPEGKPFFAGTYFPKHGRSGMPGFSELLASITEEWLENKETLLEHGQTVTQILNKATESATETQPEAALITDALAQFTESFDPLYGGFGPAPKFPSAHNVLFLLRCHRQYNNENALKMAEKTLTSMYRGGIFDHIGYGFSRYSTDRQWLVPHFEKMLYDNALCIMAYTQAYTATKAGFYKEVAEKTIDYVLKEMTGPQGQFYSAQDADQNGEEGGYYTFMPGELLRLLGEDGTAFNRFYGITPQGNMESGKSVPNLLANVARDDRMAHLRPKVYEYRKDRMPLPRDEKILTAWNALMIAALAGAGRAFADERYTRAARNAVRFIETECITDKTLYVSYHHNRNGQPGFLDDYAFMCYAYLCLYEAVFENEWLQKAAAMADQAVALFHDAENGGFYMYGDTHEKLILRPKETDDGAMPCGNSVMALCLCKLARLTSRPDLEALADSQMQFMAQASASYPAGHAFYLLAALWRQRPPTEIVCVLKEPGDLDLWKPRLPQDALITVLNGPAENYALLRGQTTFYICEDHVCRPPTNVL